MTVSVVLKSFLPWMPTKNPTQCFYYRKHSLLYEQPYADSINSGNYVILMQTFNHQETFNNVDTLYWSRNYSKQMLVLYPIKHHSFSFSWEISNRKTFLVFLLIRMNGTTFFRRYVSDKLRTTWKLNTANIFEINNSENLFWVHLKGKISFARFLNSVVSRFLLQSNKLFLVLFWHQTVP